MTNNESKEPTKNYFVGERFAPQPPSSKCKDQVIDLADYDDPGPIKDRNGNKLADFLYHKFLDLDTVDTESEAFNQEGTKQGDVEEYEIDEMVQNILINGFVKEPLLPQYDEDDRPINGRVRTKSMKRKTTQVPTVYGPDARWLPISVYKWREGVTLRQKKAVYENLNIQKPHTIQNRKTFVKGGLDLVGLGLLDPTNFKDVDHYVRNESAAGAKYNAINDVSGELAKIVKQIMKQGQNIKNGVANTKTRSRKKWEDFLEDNGYKLQNKRLVLTSVDEVTYAYRALYEHILPAVKDDKSPVEFILYTNKDDANEAKAAMEAFEALLDKLWSLVWIAVNKKTRAGFNYENFETPYIILGAVPQVIGRHNLDSAKLIKIEDY
tara:strand:+ start:188 stop:1327 length:1140 start_codon:yes stop_codon:yes gene_type:complete